MYGGLIVQGCETLFQGKFRPINLIGNVKVKILGLGMGVEEV